jgi:fucose 4-O-acetylase-like acetyltransferase
MKEAIREILQPVADIFSGFNTPEPIVHWGHPFFMGIVIFAMGSFVGITGWRSRISEDTEVKQANKLDHRKLAPFLFLFITLGYSGGVLSLIMQGQPIFESPHFWTGSTVIGLLGLNGLISVTGFGGNKEGLRTAHAYLGSIALVIMVVHAILGLKLGLSI